MNNQLAKSSTSFGPNQIAERRHPTFRLPLNFFSFIISPITQIMLSRGVLRAAAQGTRHSGAARAATFPAVSGKAPRASSAIPVDGRRYISMYGYTQAKALIYSKYGEPKDVLR